MTATTISFRADEQTMAELRQLAGDASETSQAASMQRRPAKSTAPSS